MSARHVGLVLGLLVAASACGGDDAADTVDTSTTAESPTTTEMSTSTSAMPSTSTTEVATSTSAMPSTSTTDVVATTAPAPSTTVAPTTAPPATTAPTAAMIDVKVYFFRGERLEIAHRQVAGPAVLRGALQAVLAGPTAQERAAGLTSVIPPGTTLRDLSLANGQAVVDLSGEFESGGGSMSMLGRLGQVVFTATQFDNVDRVLFWLDGRPVEYFGGEGIVLDEPQGRMNVSWEFTGGIIIDTPEPGATVRSPFTVTGEGDVFEGDFPLEVWRDGVRIAGPFIVGAGAWGDWAEFEATVTVDATPGPIEVTAHYGNGCTPGDPECGEPIITVLPLMLSG